MPFSQQQQRQQPFDHPVENIPRALPIQQYEVRHAPTALAAHPAGTQLLTASDKTAVLLDSVTAQTVRQWHGHTAVINDVAFQRQQGDVLATASYDATVCLWDGRSGSHQPLQTLKEAKDSVTAVEMVGAASICTASVDGCLRTYDVRKGVVQCDDYGSPITGIAFPTSSNSNNEMYRPFVAVSCLDGSIRVASVDDENGNLNPSALGNTAEKLPVLLTCRDKHTAGRYGLECCFNAGAAVVVSGSEDGRAAIYDCRSLVRGSSSSIRRGRLAPLTAELLGHRAPTCSVAAHPHDSDVVITASYDGNCIVWASGHDYMRWEDS